MTWTSHHHRGEVLRTVIEIADQRLDGQLPMDADGVAQNFQDDLDLIAALELRWHTRLAGQIERNLMSQPLDLETNVILAWQQTAEALPGVRAILDHYTADPATPEMAEALTLGAIKEHQLLAMMAGRASQIDDVCARAGAALEARARVARVPVPRTSDGEELSFVERIKAALVA